MNNYLIFVVNLVVPALVVLTILVIAGGFGLKKKESIKGELFDYFIQVWNSTSKKADPVPEPAPEKAAEGEAKEAAEATAVAAAAEVVAAPDARQAAGGVDVAPESEDGKAAEAGKADAAEAVSGTEGEAVLRAEGEAVCGTKGEAVCGAEGEAVCGAKGEAVCGAEGDAACEAGTVSGQAAVQNSDPDAAENFFQKFFQMLIQSYEYEKYKETVNKTKYHFYKMLVLVVVLSIPFLVLFLITRKEWILQDAEWNDMYLYTVVLVPLIFAYLVNKFVKIRQYHETWLRHMKNRHNLEWRMIGFIKDCELLKAGLAPKGSGAPSTIEELKMDFVDDMCAYWKAASEITDTGVKEENIFEDFGSLLTKS